MEIEINPAREGDYGDRRNTRVDTLILHTTEGPSIDSATSWHDREEIVASAHYFLDGRHQRIVARVPEGLAAYAAGNAKFNRRAVQIEVVGHSHSRETWTAETLALLVELSVAIVERHGIPVVHQAGNGICGHCDVPDPRNPDLRGGASHHTDPGPFFPWQEYLDAVRAELAAAKPLDPKVPVFGPVNQKGKPA